MLSHIPFEIQVEIIQRLPVRSLIQFRSVSKTWKSLIDSSEFIAAHTLRHTHPQHLLVRYEDMSETEDSHYVSFVDDDTFPHQRSDLTVPQLFELLYYSTIIGSSHGLFCLYGYLDDPGNKFGTAVLWNPSIRKWYPVIVPCLYEVAYLMDLGFGVCPVTIEPKIVMITYLEIKVYSPSSGGWRSLCDNLLCNSISIGGAQVVINGFIYWLADDKILINGQHRKLILSFDLSNENFAVMDLPDCLAWQPPWMLIISKLRESLIVLQSSDAIQINKQSYSVWMMEHGDGIPKSFTKLFTVETPGPMIKLGFRKSGELLLGTQDEYNQPSLISFEPNSKHITDLGIHAPVVSYVVNSYVETLLLLGQSHCHSY